MNKKSDYRCFLYAQVNGETVTKVCSGVDADSLAKEVDAALADGWHTTFADFIDDVPNITEEQKHAMKDVCAIAASDANKLVNADKCKDIDVLKEAYERMTGSPMDKRIKTLKAVRKACNKALGEHNVN